MSIEETDKSYIEKFRALADPESQWEYLSLLGMEKKPDETVRRDEWRIGGCRTAIWLRAGDCREGARFTGDSESLLVRGVLSILEELYLGRSLEEVRRHPPEFVRAVADEVLYPEIKENGVLKCYLRIAALERK